MSHQKHTIGPDHPILSRIGSLADEAGVNVWVVGGYVRDKLLGKEVKDIDIVVVGDGISFAKTVAQAFGRRDVVTYANFGTAMLHLDDVKVEFVTAREES
jgi:poly(A) polymerase